MFFKFHLLYVKLLLSQTKLSGPLEFEITRVDFIGFYLTNCLFQLFIHFLLGWFAELTAHMHEVMIKNMTDTIPRNMPGSLILQSIWDRCRADNCPI